MDAVSTLPENSRLTFLRGNSVFNNLVVSNMPQFNVKMIIAFILSLVFRDTSAAVISFLDGPSKNNVFHSLNLTTGRWKADHRCDPDFYRGKFELVKNMGTSDEKSSNEAQKKMWEVTWHITGPHKDQTIKTVYTQPEF